MQSSDTSFPVVEYLSQKLMPLLSVLGPHPVVQAIVIIVIFWLLSILLDKIVCGVFSKWAKKTTNTLDDHVVDIIHRPLRMVVILIGLGIATLWLEMSEKAETTTLAALKTIAVIVWLQFLIKFTRLLISYLSKQTRFNFVQTSTAPLLNNLSVAVLVALAVYSIMLSWGIDVTAWVASAGIMGLALSFAAKDTLANMFAGMSILADTPYKIGDFILLDTGERGQVTHIGMRSTRILTRDDIEVTIPNGLIGNSKIINESSGPNEKHRVRVQVNAAYGSDVDLVSDLLMKIASSVEDLCPQPAPRVRFRRFGASGLEFELLGWIEKPVLRGQVLDTLHRQIYKCFAEAGIEIPYAKQDVYIKQMPRRRGPDAEI